jgi:hypothetical protein
MRLWNWYPADANQNARQRIASVTEANKYSCQLASVTMMVAVILEEWVNTLIMIKNSFLNMCKVKKDSGN